MREILFRGKAKANLRDGGGRWIYGDLVQNDDFVFMDNGYGIKFEVDPETVGQHTGFFDKNNKRIFEGDIVRFDYVDDEGNDSHEDFLIIFASGAFRAQYLGNIKCAPNIFDDIAIDEGYVVGNKWDNPELLEVKK